MDESIIGSIKGYVGVSDVDTAFDQDIVLHINTAFSTLYQLGVGRGSPYRITSDEKSSWTELFSDYPNCIDFIKEYTFLRVRLLFDPPTNSYIMDSLKQTIQEMEYRLLMELEGYINEDESDQTGGGGNRSK